MKISVIMASWLGAPNRKKLDDKFIRAVKSFINQTHEDKELIIVSDGCQITEYLYDEHFKNINNIKFIMLEKQALYSGNIRNAGLEIATGEIISYLDSDDVIGKRHLEIINNNFKEGIDYVYYNDYLVLDNTFKKFQKRHNKLMWSGIGTSSISHRNSEKIKNIWSTGYGHDFIMMLKLNALGLKHEKIKNTPQYFVCHYSGADI